MFTVDINDFEIEKECFYQGERYCVRNNGSVLRFPKNNCKPRRLDNKWTFGKVGNHGYLYFSNKGIHRIVATAFHGENLSKDYVVDHIDTNKQNNRPENLRWITKEENLLNNPNTISKLEYITGYSIEELQENNWEKLHKYSSDKQDTSWMRPTTKEEANNFHKRQNIWRNSSNIENEIKENKIGMGEWVFNSVYEEDDDNILFNYYPSLNRNAVQTYKTETEFLCCPPKNTDNPIENYFCNLKKEKIFSKNKYYTASIIKSDINSKQKSIIVQCKSINNENKQSYSLFEIIFKNGYYIHDYKTQYIDINDCDTVYDYLLGKIPFDDNNPVLFEFEYM